MSDIKGKAGCPLCNGTGRKPGSWGVPMICDCIIEMMNEADHEAGKDMLNEENEPLLFTESINVDLQKLVNNGVITQDDLSINYSRDYTLKSLAERCEALHLRLSRQQVTDCLDTLDTILATLRAGKLPGKSYAIGAENGIGKTTFATTALKIAAQQGKTVVPYTDMSNLAEKYVEYSKAMRDTLERSKRGLYKEDEDTQKSFTWRDYVEADVCIVSLTGGNADIAYVELDTLLTLITRRSDNRKPTIVMMRTPVEYYVKFDDVRRYLIKELFTTKGKTGTLSLLERHNMFTKEPTD